MITVQSRAVYYECMLESKSTNSSDIMTAYATDGRRNRILGQSELCNFLEREEKLCFVVSMVF